MKRIVTGGAVIVFIIICYFLFEPVFVWRAGWQALPDVHNTEPDVTIKDAEWDNEITASQKLLSRFHALSQSPAVSVAVGVGNKLIWAEARGYSDIESGVVADTQTTFRIGSVSKAVTSVGLGKLLEQDMLGLDDSVGKYVAYFGNPGITIRQLASHTSGIRNYGLCFCAPMWEYYSNDIYNSVEKSVAVFGSDALLFEPGTSFSYSTYNYTLLSGVMEKASGQEFLSFMADEVFDPIGMKYTSGDYADSIIENRAKFYEVNDGEYKEVYPVDNSNKWAGGGLISTPSDLVKLGNALLNGAILKKATVDTLFAPQPLADGTMNPQHYALGWRHEISMMLNPDIEQSQPAMIMDSSNLLISQPRTHETVELFDGKKKVRAVHHGGTALGSTALLILFPEYQLSIAMIMNKHSESYQLFDYVVPIAEQFIK